ncbi:MAG TPA: universal stress protein [Cyclobacteriaceae bacterium]|nr:universal stress protein [Cyclobacteriaceae bacterium]
MSISFNKIALGIAFSPTAEAMLSETARLARLFTSEVLLIHVGTQTPEAERRLNGMIDSCGLVREKLSIAWESGEPAKVILACCKKHKVDLLVTGALKKENLVQFYVGTIARKVLRKAGCAVLTIINPTKEERPYKNVVVSAEDSTYVKEAIYTACQFVPRHSGAWVHIVREVKLYGLTMAASDQYTEEEYDDARQGLVKQEIQKVEEMLQRIPHEGIRVNIKMVSGKSGFELPRFAERKSADLLVVGAPPRKFSFLDRIFPHDIEYILADLPCSLLVVQPSKYHG